MSMLPAVTRKPAARYPLVCFDLDGTLVDDTIYIWQTMHTHFGTDVDRRRRAKEDFFAGRISYEEWFETDLELLREAGADRGSLIRLFHGLQPMSGAQEVLDALAESGVKIAVLSGSVDLLLETLFPNRRFDAVLINRLEFDGEGRLVGGESTPYDLEKKADGLEALARRFGLDTRQVAFVGDNSNDIAVARRAGFSIAFNCKSEELADVADVVVAGSDLRSVLPHLMELDR